MSDWKLTRIDQMAEVVGGSTPSTSDPENFDGDVPWLTPKDLSDYPFRYVSRGQRNITQKGLRQIGSRLLPSGTVLLTTRAPVGYLAIASNPITTNQGFRSLIPRDGYYGEFLYYLLSANIDVLKAHATGTTFAELSGGTLKSLEFRVPDFDSQVEIAGILGALDDKITLNRQMSATLEAIARALFQSWFVDFDPVRAKAEGRAPDGMDAETAALFPASFEDSTLGTIPSGWRVGTFGEVAENFDSRRIPLSRLDRELRQGTFPYYGAASVMDFVDDWLFEGVHLLFAEDGSVKDDEGSPVLQYVWGQFWVNNHAHVLKGRNGVSTEHLYMYARNIQIDPYVTGAVQPKVTQANLNRIPLVIAPEAINRAFQDKLDPLFSQHRQIEEESLTLAEMRDALLPRLMNGELL